MRVRYESFQWAGQFFFVLIFIRSKRYAENITLLRALAGPGSTGVNGRLRPIH